MLRQSKWACTPDCFWSPHGVGKAFTISSEVAEHRLWYRMHVRMPFANDSTTNAAPPAMQFGACPESFRKSVLNCHKKVFCEDAGPENMSDTGAEIECTMGLATTCKRCRGCRGRSAPECGRSGRQRPPSIFGMSRVQRFSGSLDYSANRRFIVGLVLGCALRQWFVFGCVICCFFWSCS